MKQIFYFLLGTIFCLASCKKEDTVSEGASLNVGNGKVHAWVKTNSDDEPVSIGFTMTAEALNNLPEGSAATGHSTNFRLALPAEASKTAFDHLDLGWVLHGHEPAGIYNVPHFDFHFYTVSPADHDNIPPYSVDKTKFDKDPVKGSLPVNYAKNPAGVPGMGCHWTDTKGAEFNGKAFTETFIFGSYDGRVNFWESMITHAILKNSPNISRDIPQPTVYDQTGKFYPTTMRVYNDGTNVVFAMENMVKR